MLALSRVKWASLVNKMLRIIWELELIQQNISNRLHMFAEKTRKELLQRIFSATRSIKNAAVPRKITSSLVRPVGKCIRADGGQFEQFA